MADGYKYNPQYDQGPQVVQHQPGVPGPPGVVQHQPTVQGVRPWKSSLFDCLDDLPICLCGTFCGICLVAQTAGDMQESKCVACCVPAPVLTLRTKWRTQHNIEGTIMNDCLLQAFCGACAACQLAREVKSAKMTQGLNIN